MRMQRGLLVAALLALGVARAARPAPTRVELQLVDASGKVVARRSGQGAVELRAKRPFAQGDRGRVTGPTHVALRVPPMPEAFVYCPKGVFEFPIPFDKAARACGRFDPKRARLTARPATPDEMAAERNLALNPYDTPDSKAFPHATTNNVCRDDPVFAARNAIDGVAKPKGHGAWPHQSWGPDRRDGLWWRIDFGRDVSVSQLRVVLRADVPHDAFFAKATVVGSDGTRKAIAFRPTGARQTFALGSPKVRWLELRDFPKPPKWAAVTEIEVWGREATRYGKRATWRETLVSALASGPSQVLARAMRDFPDDWMRLAVVADWALQDKLDAGGTLRPGAVDAVVGGLGDAARDLRAQVSQLAQESAPPTDPRWADLYLQACERRRAARLATHAERFRRVVFTRHYDLGGSHYAYTEGQSDAQAERHFKPGTALCLLDMDGLYGRITTLIDDPKGVIRDPDVSFDAQRILFAWKKDDRKDDYHLHEMAIADRSVRQLTDGLGFADYEPAYLPNGHIVFNSTRCVQIVDCWWTEVSNLYTCDADGRFLRRLSFDQVHTNFPTVTPDGRVIYTRWDYSDRGQVFPQGLFQMNPDGTAQTAAYGNNSWFPTTILHARAIPGSQKVVCVLSGHHCHQRGHLALLDFTRHREENAGVQLIAPVRETKAVHVDAYGQNGPQFQFPYPLSTTEFLVTHDPVGGGNRRYGRPFAIYWMNLDGERELLVAHPRISCNQPVPLVPRPVPHLRPDVVNYREKSASVFLHDVYAGPGLKGIERGTIRKLRVVTLEFRAAGIGRNSNRGPAGGAMASTPVSIQGAWDPKRVLGTATVHPDGSACFTAPARTPFYFQALDAKGHAVQTMRSWLTLQPGESVSCVGCHEPKYQPPAMSHTAQALRRGPQPLEPWEGAPEPFSFIRHLQPILDRHCTRCHNQRGALAEPVAKSFDPKTMRLVAPIGKAQWRHTTTPPGPKWHAVGYDDSKWAVAPGGFGDRGVPDARAHTPWKTDGIWLRRTFPIARTPASPRVLLHHDAAAEVYVNGRLAVKAPGYVRTYVVLPMRREAARTLGTGVNLLAVHCAYRGGGRYIDAGIVDLAPDEGKHAAKPPPPGVEPAFSLLGTQILDRESQRKWSDAYKALANRKICNWINVQSAPPMLPPYHAGAARSQLIALLDDGHYGVELSPRELARFALWIDLLVPYVGDYREAMADDQVARYDHFLAKRRRMAELEARNIADWLDPRPGAPAGSP